MNDVFFVILLLLLASAFVSNLKVDDGIKVGVNVIIVIIFVIMILVSIF